MTIYSRQSKLVLQPHLSSSTNIIHQETRAKEGACMAAGRQQELESGNCGVAGLNLACKINSTEKLCK